MAFTEDLSVFLQDFGVACTAGSVTALGILDMPSQIISGDMVLTTDYTLTARAADFGGLLYGDGITVDGVNYQVREVRKLDDGMMVEVGLQRLAPTSTAPGANPREFGLADLTDVSITDPQVGDKLIREATQWVNYAEPETLIDASTAGAIYVGTAPAGTAEGDAAWTIIRSLFSAAGIRTGKGTSTNVTWTGRASHTYT